MQEQKVLITIDPKDPENKVKLQVEGIQGTKCVDLVQLLTQGSEVVDQGYTEEYLYQQELPAYVEDL